MILKLLAFPTGVTCFRAGQAHSMHHQTWSNNTNNRESQDITYRPIIIKTSVTQKEKSKGICKKSYFPGYPSILFPSIGHDADVYAPIASCLCSSRFVKKAEMETPIS